MDSTLLQDKIVSGKEQPQVPKAGFVPYAGYVNLSDGRIQLPHKTNTHPRLYGKDAHACRVCRNTHGLIRKYGLSLCRRCFRERAEMIGFKQTR